MNLAKQPDAMTHPDGMQIKITRQEIGQMVGCSGNCGTNYQDVRGSEPYSCPWKTIVVYGAR